jgi:RsiW-degrading membrane proteinase PrsW (M82 family)
MNPADLIKIAIALVPVLICLALFVSLDVFKLMKLSEVVGLLIGGAILAAMSYGVAASYFAVNWRQVADLPLGRTDYTRWVAPAVEEALKGALIVFLFWRNRIGYLVDAAISGFAVGAGFSLAENLLYLHDFLDVNLGVWLVRGLGTAIMHGGAVAIMACASQALLAPRLRLSTAEFRLNPLAFLPGLLAAFALHATFNHFPDQPLADMAIVLVAVPITLFVIFAVGERYAHRWLADDQAAHAQLLGDLQSGAFDDTEAGRALASLAERLGERGAELMAYVRLHTALVVRAEATLLAVEGREAVELTSLKADFAQLHAFEKTLGRAAVAAVRQHLKFSRNDLWEMHELEEDVGKGKS